MDILFLVSEIAPFYKVGGLADVAGSLPQALGRLGLRIRVVVPLHSSQPPEGFTPLPGTVPVTLHHRREEVSFWQRELSPGVTLYLADNPRYFRRPRVYEEPDDLERFCLFSLSSVRLPSLLGIRPQVVHGHDWHTGLAFRALKEGEAGYATPSLLTIHNIQYQGLFSPEWFTAAIDGAFPEGELFRLNGIWPNLLSLGLLHADRLSTVSPTFAREVVTPEYACALDSLFARRPEGVVGILNGIDTQEYNPATDPYLPTHYDASSLEKRGGNKAALQRRAGLPVTAHVPLFSMVTRLANQKGIDLLPAALREFLPRNQAQFVLLGRGEEKYHQTLQALAQKHPGQVAAFLTFDEAIARLIYGGCDIFMMPSLFEPCGLGQLIAMRYGAIPLVRRTGGLADTVEDTDGELSRGTGFVFSPFTPAALTEAMGRAAAAYRRRPAWLSLMRRAMAQDFSWDASAKQYQQVYQSLARPG